jgi:GT2 family glycosyltransferase
VKPARVCTVILNWNQPAMTADCARSVLAQEVPGGQAVVVVDNGSTDANRAALRAALPAGCGLIQNVRNRGFAGGMNVGIRHALRAGHEYVWLVNNDAFPEPGCLAALAGALDGDPRLAAVGPALFGTDGREQFALGRVGWNPLTTEVFPAGECPGPLGEGYWLSGTAPLLRAAALAALGGFDERFFAYWEETDLFLRAARRGFLLRAVPEARCQHLGSASTGGGESPVAWHMIARNAWLFLRKHVPLRRLPATGLALLAYQISVAGGMNSRGRAAAARAYLAGTIAGSLCLTGRPRKARADQWWMGALWSHFWGVKRVLDRLARLIPTGVGPLPAGGRP